jgi:hypothetical protein
MKPIFLCIFLLSVAAISMAQDSAHVPDLDGYVTRAASPTDFDANGFHVISNKKTTYSTAELRPGGSMMTVLGEPQPYVGAHVRIFGKVNIRKQTIKAETVLFLTADSLEVKGNAVIDGLPTRQPDDAEGKLVRADGYRILLTPKTTMTFTAPLTSLSDVQPNLWIAYRGERRKDGVILASSGTLTRNDRVVREEKAREKADYDPEAVAPDEKQSAAGKVFLGIDPRKIPPYHDDAMQARIAKIGNTLVPQYQKDLPDSDPAKLSFRFQLVDEPKWRDAMIWPSGVILVPKQLVERMENDSQLAAVLADSIAALLEDQYYRLQSLARKAGAAEMASGAIPVAGFVGIAAASKVYADAVRRAQDQAGRVSLGLMNDAGYTLTEAPKAWWILSTKEPKPLVDLQLPERVQYLYEVLDTAWRQIGH